MAWFGEGFSSLTGQIKNITKDIVATNVVGLGSFSTPDTEGDSPGDAPLSSDNDVKSHLEQLQEHCKVQDEEILKLRMDNERLQRRLTPRDRRVSEEVTLESELESVTTALPLVPLDHDTTDSFLGQDHVPKDVKAEEEISSLRIRLRKMFQEKVLMEQSCMRMEKEVALLTEARHNRHSTDGSTQTDGSNQPAMSTDLSVVAQENERLKHEKAMMRIDITRLIHTVQDLESQVATSQDQNANLSTGMEDLDIQHQEAIEQVMVLKDSTQKRYEILQTEFEDLKQKYEKVIKSTQVKNQNMNVKSVDCQTSGEVLCDAEEIKAMITTEIPDKYFETSKANASGLETVAAVEKMLSHTIARVESSEAKIRELLKELRNRDNEVQEIEEENRILRSKIDELKEEINNLPTITENSEDVEAMESKIMSLENEITILREVRSNLEVEHSNSRSEIESLIRRLQTAEAMIRNQDNLQTEILKYKESEEDLLKKLSEAEKHKEELSSLQCIVNEHVKENNELKSVNEKIEEELTKYKDCDSMHLKLLEELKQEKTFRMQLEKEKESHKENDLKHLKLLEEYEMEKSLKSQLEKEKEKLLDEVQKLESSGQSLELQIEEKKQMLEQQIEAKVKELKSSNTFLSQKCVKYEKEIFELSERLDCLKIESDLKDRKLCEIILEKSVTDKEIKEIRTNKESIEKDLEDLKKQITSREDALLKDINDAFGDFLHNCSLENLNLQTCISEIKNMLIHLENTNKSLVNENTSLLENIKCLNFEASDKKDSLLKMATQLETLKAEKHSIEDSLRNLKETVSVGNQTDKAYDDETTQETYREMHRKLEENEGKYRELESQFQKLRNSSDQTLTHVNDQLRNLQSERQQLIETVQTKHAECVRYHTEIQRLCAEVAKLEQLHTTITAKLEEKECDLETMQANNDRQVATLTEQVDTLQGQLDYVSQLLRVTDRQEAEGQPANDSPSMEAKRSDELNQSLQQEQLRNKYLQDEVSEQHDKEASLIRELERLRNHLVTVEDNYTQEMVRAEQQTQELSQRLAAAEERAKTSSTAYTSASIRANQQVESLSVQLRQLSELKERLLAQLAAAEDKNHKQAAALTNLQIVLEQFQRDKERDVGLETERLSQTLYQAHQRHADLLNEITALQGQLREAKEGLSAASRLSEQLDQRAQTISELRHQVSELEDRLRKADERLQAASVNVEGKVDRCLVRNLVVGYISAPPTSQHQALAIIASVLNFTSEDRQRSGLDPSTGLKQQSLSEAFVQFLENESRPHLHLRLPLQGSEKTQGSRKTSVSEVGLPPARRTSGSVLKDVLKQDL